MRKLTSDFTSAQGDNDIFVAYNFLNEEISITDSPSWSFF